MNRVQKLFGKIRRGMFGLKSQFISPLMFHDNRNSYTFLVDNERFAKIQDREITAIVVQKSIHRNYYLLFKTYCKHTFSPFTEHYTERYVDEIFAIKYRADLVTKFRSLNFPAEWKLGNKKECEMFGFPKEKSLLETLWETNTEPFVGFIITFKG